VKLVWGLELALGLELYACAVLALHARGLRATPLLATPGLVIPALVIPPVFYMLVGLVSVRPRSLVRVMSAVGAMCGVHALLVAATGALFVIPDLVDYGAAVAFSLWGSPAVTMLQLTAAPLVMARLRPLLLTPRSAPRPEVRAAPPQRRAEAPGSVVPPPAASPAQREKAVVAPAAPPAQRASVVTSPTAPPAPREPIVASPPAAPTARTPIATRAAVLTPRAPAVIPPGASPFRIGDSPRTVVRSEAPSGPVEPAPSTPVRKAAPQSAEPMVSVPFSRIADQLPVEMFVHGREGLSNALRPGVSLLVPRRLLLPHLGEGLAPVKWEVVADQFPHDELMLTHDEIASRLPDGALLLPLDEVVPQIPAELLALSTPTADVYGIEEFPPPSQPHVPPPSETVAGDAAEAPELEAVELDEPEPLSRQALPEFEQGTDVPVDRDQTAEARRLATLLVPLMNGLRLGERYGAGTPLVTVVASTLSEDAVVGTAVRVAPFLTDARLSEPVTQATLTGLEAAIVLTPFGSPDTGALLVTAVASRASLAWLERLSRSAAGGPRVIVQNGAHTLDGHREETALRATVVPSSVRELAGLLTAFGPVAPTVVRDAGGSFRVCLFLPGSLEALPLAQFARDLCGALEKAEIGRVASVILRLGTHRLILRSVESASGHATILVVGGPVARPGLARIELDRAATRLGAFGQD
jgi:hypothetical protein